MIDRRSFVVGTAASSFLLASNIRVESPPSTTRMIRSSGETIPVIGMGSWLTFDIENDPAAMAVREKILEVFFLCGGRMIDSSPMYGSSQSVIGKALAAINIPNSVFAADKVWTRGKISGQKQIEESRQKWGLERFQLLQVHNLTDWNTQLATLFEMKEAGQLRYVGITSYDGLQYDLLEQIMSDHPIDFVQFSYNIEDRRAENRLLPLAKEREISVIANRPFQEGRLIRKVANRRLPAMADEIESESWAQYLLQWIVSNPAVTVAIPATSQVNHMRENVGVLHKPLPDGQLREKMARDFLV